MEIEQFTVDTIPEDLLRTAKEKDEHDYPIERWIINPKDFALTTHTLIPIKQAYQKEETPAHEITPEIVDPFSILQPTIHT